MKTQSFDHVKDLVRRNIHCQIPNRVRNKTSLQAVSRVKHVVGDKPLYDRCIFMNILQIVVIA